MNREILIFQDSHILTNFLLKKWNAIARQAIREHQRFTVALSGGRTPIEFYRRLSGFTHFDLWEQTHVFLVDERFVPFEDPESNFGMLKKNLLHCVNIPSQNIHPIRTDQGNITLATERFKDDLLQFFNIHKDGLPCFDLILLGVGEDGHVASLFPGNEGINDPQQFVMPVASGRLKDERISLTLPVINHATAVIFLVLGSPKAGVLKQIIEQESSLPAAMVKPTHGKLTWLLDKEAARKLSYREFYTYHNEAISMT